MNSEQRAMADELDELAAGCAVYSPDQCATMIDGIGWIAMRHKLRKAAELLRALEQPASAAGVEGWRPIETAPRGDGVVLVGWGEYRERDGYSPAFMRWYDLVGGWTVNAMPFYPTHWMPLPAAPKPEDAS